MDKLGIIRESAATKTNTTADLSVARPDTGVLLEQSCSVEEVDKYVFSSFKCFHKYLCQTNAMVQCTYQLNGNDVVDIALLKWN